MTTTQRDAISAAKGLVLFNTTTNTLQINEGDATTANWLSLTASTCGLSIGDTHQGGIIFYLDASGCHGLIAAPGDQSTGIQMVCRNIWFYSSQQEMECYGRKSKYVNNYCSSSGYWR